MQEWDELVRVVARLRGEGGCPWDRAQTPETLRPYILEEAHEVLDVIDRMPPRGQASPEELRKELGDLVFQVVLLAQMAQDSGWFRIEDVLRAITDKMVRRHPHVFDPDHERSSADQGIAAWEARKAKERPRGRSALAGVPAALPALLRAHRVSEKASGVGFDWPDTAGVRMKVDEELAELDAAIASGDPEAMDEELGDLLFTLVNLGRHLPIPSGAEESLRGAIRKFSDRFERLEAALEAEGRTLHDTDAQTLEARWRQVSRELRQEDPGPEPSDPNTEPSELD